MRSVLGVVFIRIITMREQNGEHCKEILLSFQSISFAIVLSVQLTRKVTCRMIADKYREFEFLEFKRKC